jgi:hypothetical protein
MVMDKTMHDKSSCSFELEAGCIAFEEHAHAYHAILCLRLLLVFCVIHCSTILPPPGVT